VHSHPTFPADNAFPIWKKSPSRRQAMRPIVNLSEEDRTTDTGNMHKKLGKDRACGSGDILADRQTDRQTHPHADIFITILRNHFRGRSRLINARSFDVILTHSGSISPCNGQRIGGFHISLTAHFIVLSSICSPVAQC